MGKLVLQGRPAPSHGWKGCIATACMHGVCLPLLPLCGAPPPVPGCLLPSSPNTAPGQDWHFDVDASRNRLDLSWRLRAGTSEAGHYGLELARTVGFPPDVVQAAEEVVAGAGFGPRVVGEGAHQGQWSSQGARSGGRRRAAPYRCAIAPCPFPRPPAVLDASEAGRVAAYATPGAAEREAVCDIVHKLACVAQSFAAAGGAGDSGEGGGDVRALQKQLRRLKVEAGQALAAAQEEAVGEAAA